MNLNPDTDYIPKLYWWLHYKVYNGPMSRKVFGFRLRNFSVRSQKTFILSFANASSQYDVTTMGTSSRILYAHFYSKFRYFTFRDNLYQFCLGSLTGPILCYFIGGPFIERFGWENLFIWGGILGIFSGILYSCLVEAEPEQSKLVCEEELDLALKFQV